MTSLTDGWSFNENYPTIRTTAPILGLYFSAGWCPDCVAATPPLDGVISNQDSSKPLVDVFYISSDRTADGMKEFKPTSFSEVPFDDVDTRTSLKRTFGTCAMKEVTELGLDYKDRKHGIPTLILIDSTTGKVVTENGLDAIDNFGTDAGKVLSQWKSLLSDI